MNQQTKRLGGCVIIAFLLAILGCHQATRHVTQPEQAQKDVNVLGKWFLVAPEEEAQADNPSPRKHVNELVFKEDDTYSENCDGNALGRGSGTYTVSGNIVTLTTAPIYQGSDKYDTITLQYKDGLLLECVDNSYGYVYARINTQTADEKRKLMAASKHTEPEAEELIKQVEDTYRSLSSYSDQGTQRNPDSEEVEGSVRFHVRFLRPQNYLFYGESFWVNEYPADTIIRYRYGMMQTGAKLTLRSGNDIGTLKSLNLGIQVCEPLGEEVLLIPRLLMHDKVNLTPLSERYPWKKLLKDESIDGTLCKVIRLSDMDEYGLTLWVDSKRMLILKAFEDRNRQTIRFHPIVNRTLSPSEFSLKSPPGGTTAKSEPDLTPPKTPS